jgi:hypothetical protein
MPLVKGQSPGLLDIKDVHVAKRFKRRSTMSSNIVSGNRHNTQKNAGLRKVIAASSTNDRREKNMECCLSNEPDRGKWIQEATREEITTILETCLAAYMWWRDYSATPFTLIRDAIKSAVMTLMTSEVPKQGELRNGKTGEIIRTRENR